MPAQRRALSVLIGLAATVLLANVLLPSSLAGLAPAVLDIPFVSQTALKGQHTVSGEPYTLGNSKTSLLWEYGCGVASLAMVFRQYGADTDLVQLNEKLRQTGGFSGPYLAWSKTDAFTRAGAPWIQGIERINTARPQGQQNRLDDELALGHPVIAYLGGRHYVVLTGKDDKGNYRINDPWKVSADKGKDIALEKNDLKLGFKDITQFIFIYPDRNAPRNGVAVVGAIADKYYAEGGSRSALGDPVGPAGQTFDGGRWQAFQDGAILAVGSGVYILAGPVWDKYLTEGLSSQTNTTSDSERPTLATGGKTMLGWPVSDVYSYFVGPSVAWRADFESGSIVWMEGDRPQDARVLTARDAFKAEYYTDAEMAGSPAYTRYEDALSFDWGEGAPGPWVGPEVFAARWTGTVRVRFPLGWWYNFVIDSDGGVRVKLDGQVALDTWGAGKGGAFTRALGRGTHTLEIEYQHRGGAAHLRAGWSPAPARPAFAAERSTGPFEALPASVVQSVPDLATPLAQAAATASAVMATMTAEARVTPTPDTAVATVARQSFEGWAQAQGEPWRDAQVSLISSDGYFAEVQVVAWFRPSRDVAWEERQAQIECRRVGAEWQCDPAFDFALTDAERARRGQATATAAAQATATSVAKASATAAARATTAAVQPTAVAGPSPRALHPEWTTYTNGNLVQGLLVQGDVAWAATFGGVVRWDARTGNYVKLTTQDGLTDNWVQAITAGPDGTLWFGTNGGVSGLGPDGNWKTFTTKDGLASNQVTAIAARPDGALWFGTFGGGVSRLGPDGGWKTFTTQDGLADNRVLAIAAGPDGALWFGATGGVSRLGPDGNWKTFTTQDGLTDNWVQAITAGPDGTLWFGTNGGVSRLGPDGGWKTFTTQDGLADNRVLAIAAGPDGALWFGTPGGGVSRLGPDGNWKTFTANDGLADNRVFAFAAGPDGALWFGTFGGVSRLGPDGGWRTFTTKDGLADNRVHAIAAGPEGALWFGTSGGVSRLGPDGNWKTFTTQDGLASNEVYAIAAGPDGARWSGFGTSGGGVSRLGPDGNWKTFTTQDGLASNEVYAIAAGPEGALWFGTSGGVSRLGPDGNWKTFTTQDGLASNKVHAIAAGPDGALWFGTSGGVSRLGPDGNWKTFTTQDGLASNEVYAIAAGPDGALWFGFSISGDGVSRLGPDGNWKTFTTQDGLTDNWVQAITAGPDGTQWFGTSGGVSRLGPDGGWQTFTTTDGLADNVILAIAAGPDGAVWFGTWDSGVSRYRP